MIVPDTNLLLYAYNPSCREHAVARAWWEGLLGGAENIGLTCPVLFGFVRVATNRRVFDPAPPVEQVVAAVESWFIRPSVRVLHPGSQHLAIAFRLLRALGTGGNLTTDIQIAALAIEHQAEVHSSDAHFGLIPGVRWHNPLAMGPRSRTR